MPNIHNTNGGEGGEPGRLGLGEGGVEWTQHLNYDAGPLAALNSDIRYNFLPNLNNTPDENDIISPYIQNNVSSPYFNTKSLISSYSQHKQPLFLSLNTQSLQSKHENIKILLAELASKNVHVDILALQETWRLPYVETVDIPGYQFVHRHRTANKGGGVGFYIKNAITFKLIAELSTFVDNVFETITIEAKVQNKTYMLSSVYRSPNPPANMSTNIQLTNFNTHLDTLLARLNALKLNSYIFLDSNLNLLHISTDNNAANYRDLITSNGYLQTITRATRIQNNNFSLIDHILTNSPSTKSQSGILISDISDHFFTFTLPDYLPQEISATLIFNVLGTHLGTSLGNTPLTQTMQMIAITHSGLTSSRHMTLTSQKSLGEQAKTSIKSATFLHRNYCKHIALR
jgi:exonuclease III